ncbi:hypothetical protein ACX8XP_11265 [Calditrichota bacterium LG25]
MKLKPKLLLSLFILVTCQSFDLVYAKDIEYACLTVSVDEFSKNPGQVCRFINQLLQLDYPVYRCAQHKKIGKITLRPGDFIVVTENSRRRVLFIDYLKSENFVKGRDIDLPLEVEAYPLKEGKVAVYDGNYAQDGADMHVKTLRELGFDVRLMGDDDLFEHRLIYPEYIAFVLPGLGGDGGTVWYSPGIKGKKELQKFVKSGGGIFGTCAGAGLIVQKNEFYDELPSFYLGLAPIAHSVTFRGRGLIKEKILDKDNPIFFGLSEPYYALHSGGGGMRALNKRAKPVAVYSSLDKFKARPWARNYFNWDSTKQSFKPDPFPETEKDARKWLEPYLNNPNYASTIIAKNGKGKVVATGNHPEILAQMEEGCGKWEEGICFTNDDITNGYIYEANVIYFITQGERKKITLKPGTMYMESGEKFTFKRNAENLYINEYQSLLEKMEMKIDSLDFIINDIETKKTGIKIGSWHAVKREVNRLKDMLHAFKGDLKSAPAFGVVWSFQEANAIKNNFNALREPFKEAKKYLFYINNAVYALNYAVKQKEKVHGQHGSENREESWATIENYLKTYLSDVTPSDKNVEYVFGKLFKSPGYTLNMVLHDIKKHIIDMHQQLLSKILMHKFNNLKLN